MTPEQIARELAHWHGQKMLYRKPGGPMMTVAMHRQGTDSGFAGVVDDYVRNHWREYMAAAEFVETARLDAAKAMQERCAAKIDAQADKLQAKLDAKPSGWCGDDYDWMVNEVRIMRQDAAAIRALNPEDSDEREKCMATSCTNDAPS